MTTECIWLEMFHLLFIFTCRYTRVHLGYVYFPTKIRECTLIEKIILNIKYIVPRIDFLIFLTPADFEFIIIIHFILYLLALKATWLRRLETKFELLRFPLSPIALRSLRLLSLNVKQLINTRLSIFSCCFFFSDSLTHIFIFQILEQC